MGQVVGVHISGETPRPQVMAPRRPEPTTLMTRRSNPVNIFDLFDCHDDRRNNDGTTAARHRWSHKLKMFR
jgi:hypothetical protein